MSQQQPNDGQGPKGLGYVILVIVIFGGLILGLSSWRNQLERDQKQVPDPAPVAKPLPGLPSKGISKSDLDAINPGMNLDEVEKVLGPGKLVSETKTEKHVYDLYAWGDPLNGTSVSVTFIDGSASEISATGGTDR
jgi:hypothetical protein|tara:strand:+ start:370 stop:777 length:408 start_codon:yes stop_codon:yes gene_type:complete